MGADIQKIECRVLAARSSTCEHVRGSVSDVVQIFDPRLRLPVGASDCCDCRLEQVWHDKAFFSAVLVEAHRDKAGFKPLLDEASEDGPRPADASGENVVERGSLLGGSAFVDVRHLRPPTVVHPLRRVKNHRGV